MARDDVAGGGLLNRRRFLALGAAGSAAVMLPVKATEPWQRVPGPPPSEYSEQSPFAQLRRTAGSHPFGPAAGSSSTPLQDLNGIITPSGLHFERHHSGVPEIDPERHQLTVHGGVRRGLTFTLDKLLRYPMTSNIQFLECSGNSYRNTLPTALDRTAGELNGLLSCSEWTGVPLHYLFEEAGMVTDMKWVIAEGADASGNNRSVPLEMALERGIVAIYQNGEPLRPSQGYPMRLFMPGCEGNISIKWLRSLKLTREPAYTREETSKYTDLQRDGRARLFSLSMELKSLITSPSGKMQLPDKGVYEISGLAWSGGAPVRAVEVSADGGQTWAEAELQTEVVRFRPVRFRIPWRWDGQPAVLQSRAIDIEGGVQPTRKVAIGNGSPAEIYHYNGIQSWAVDAGGRVRNVYA